MLILFKISLIIKYIFSKSNNRRNIKTTNNDYIQTNTAKLWPPLKNTKNQTAQRTKKKKIQVI